MQKSQTKKLQKHTEKTLEQYIKIPQKVEKPYFNKTLMKNFNFDQYIWNQKTMK